MDIRFASRVRVFANDAVIFDVHASGAARLLRDGLAIRRCSGKKVCALDLVTTEMDCTQRKALHGNPQKYTFVEALGAPVNSHCHSLKLQIASPKNWPIFRAALVDCLPGDKQAEIRQLFAPRNQAA